LSTVIPIQSTTNSRIWYSLET